MFDYKPDTSLYTDPADRLIALGLAVKSGKPLQYKSVYVGKWDVPTRNDPQNLVSNVLEGSDYRIAPEPFGSWFVVDNQGNVSHVDEKHGAQYQAKLFDKTYPACAPHRAVYLQEVQK